MEKQKIYIMKNLILCFLKKNKISKIKMKGKNQL